MMMTACDVAAITKPWKIQHEVAQLVASEFFEQGDLERQQLQAEPIVRLSREAPSFMYARVTLICIWPMFSFNVFHITVASI